MIFVIKLFQRNVAFDIATHMRPQLESSIKESVVRAVDEALLSHWRHETIVGIRSVFRGLKEGGGSSGLGGADARAMYERAKTDFLSQRGRRLSHASLDLPL